MTYTNELNHSGVKGMRWGVRKDRPNKIKVSKKTKADPKSMSDEELKKVVNRLQMERQYSQLSSTEVSKGKRYAQKVMKVGTTVATVTTTGLTIYNNIDKIKSIVEKTKK